MGQTKIKKGKTIGTCGHEIIGDLSQAGLLIRDFTKEGKKCIASVVLCAKCRHWYENRGFVIHNKKEERGWLKKDEMNEHTKLRCKKKSIYKELTLDCVCPRKHWVHCWYDIDEKYGNDFSIAFIDGGCQWIKRLKQGIKHIFNRNDNIYFSDISLPDENLKKLRDFIDEYLKEEQNNENSR